MHFPHASISAGFIATPAQKRLENVLLVLIATLILEGLFRRLLPQLNMVFFFIKDLLTLLLGILTITSNAHPVAKKLLMMQGVFFLLMIPPALSTSMHDAILAIFGIKQYVLFPFAASALCAAYLPSRRVALQRLCGKVTYSIVPTALLALLQSKLPADHWLNQTPDGESLEAFSAGGQLRVSSSFPFVAQYGMYLNALVPFIGVWSCMRRFRQRAFLAKTLPLLALILPLLILSIFITGSRLAVLGVAASVAVGVSVIVFTTGRRFLPSILLVVTMGCLCYPILKLLHPDSFAAYEARTTTTDINGPNHTEQTAGRLLDGMVNWIPMIYHQPPLGNGLGVMSNGSQKISSYAAGIRQDNYWMETELASIMYEGGVYVLLVWYGLRLIIIGYTGFCLLTIDDPKLAVGACFCWGFVVIQGIMGTLSIQPPLAIWWWLSVGLILCLREFDRETEAPYPPILNHAGHLRNPSGPI
jgi:hypothetical protein